MADKRITTVDEMTNPDERADFVLIVRGAQKDLRRLRLIRLPVGFDLHDDVDTELTTPANIDRMLISDEGTPGAPNRWVKLATLQSFFTNAFDLHDDVDTELTEAAAADRLLISDEGESGDPQKWISVENLLKSSPGLRVWHDTSELSLAQVHENRSHSLGVTPKDFSVDLVFKSATSGWSVGDKIIGVNKGGYTRLLNGNRYFYNWVIRDLTSTTYTLNLNTDEVVIPHKTNGGTLTSVSASVLRAFITLYG